MRVLVTGAAGKIGAVVVKHLLDSDFEVRATDFRFKTGLPGRLDMADLTDPHAAYRLLEGVDAVVHLGNLPTAFSGTPQHVMSTNTAINTNVFVAARELGLKRIVFASTVQTMLKPSPDESHRFHHGHLPHLPVDGQSPVSLDNNYYALSKIFAEQMLRGLVQSDEKMVCTVLRLPWVVSDKGIARLREGKEYWVNYNEGSTYLSRAAVASLIQAVLQKQKPGYHCYFPAQTIGIKGWSSKRVIEHYMADLPSRDPGSPPDRIVDMRQLESDLGWVPDEPLIETDPSA